MFKFAISNLSFGKTPIKDALKLLETSQVEGLEIAPTLIWKEPENSSKKERKAFKSLVADHGLSIVALQSLMYNQPTLQLFDDSARILALNYLKKLVDLCAELGGQSLSFGSPRNRIKGDLDFNEAINQIAPLFYSLAEHSKKSDVFICIEPVSPEYNCDFIQNTDEAAKLIDSVKHSHFKLLLDVGNLIYSKDNCKILIQKYIHQISHVHINDMKLFPPSSKHNKEHSVISETLKLAGYSNWLSLEFLNYYNSLEVDIRDGIQCYRQA